MKTPGPISKRTEIEARAAEWIGRRDQGLTAAEQAEFERWQAENELNRRALARLEATWTALERPRQTGTAALLALELAALRRRRRRIRTGGVVALFLVGLGLVVPRLATRSATAVVLTSERRTLPDGSIVEFPSGTNFAVEFSDVVRRVVLKRGDAHFEVVKDVARPFQVTAGDVTVKAVGTAFALQYSGAAVDVLVTEGRVSVGARTERGSAEQTAALVVAGHRVTIDDTRTTTPEIMAITEAEIDERLAWRKPRVEFSGTPLVKVVSLLNQHNATRIVIADAALEATALSGVFRLNDTEAFVRILERGFSIRADRRDREVVLYKMP